MKKADKQKQKTTETVASAPAEFKIINRSKILVLEQVRKDFDPNALQELANSIKVDGIISPLLVRPRKQYTLVEPDMASDEWQVLCGTEVIQSMSKAVAMAEKICRHAVETQNQYSHELVSGERRYRASEMVGLHDLPCMVQEMTDEEKLRIQLIENAQRKDLTAIEEAMAFAEMKDKLGYSIDQISDKTGKKRSTVYAALQLLEVAPIVREAIADGRMPATIGNLIATLPTEELQATAANDILRGANYEDCDAGEEEPSYKRECLSFRQAKAHLRRRYTTDLDEAKFDLTDADLVPVSQTLGGERTKGGACSDCPFRSGTDPEMFPGIKNPNVCTRPNCFKEKVEAQQDRELQSYRDRGIAVLDRKEAQTIFHSYGWLKNDAPYVKEDDNCHEDEERRSYKELIGKKVKPVIVVNPESGNIVRLLPKEAVQEVLPKLGIKLREEEPEETPEQKAKRELEAKVEKESAEAIVREMARLGPKLKAEAQVKLLRLAVVGVWENWEGDAEEIGKLFGAPSADIEGMKKLVSKMELKELVTLLAVMGCQNYYGLDEERLPDLAKAAGVDTKKIQKQVRADLESKLIPDAPKAKGKGKAVAK